MPEAPISLVRLPLTGRPAGPASSLTRSRIGWGGMKAGFKWGVSDWKSGEEVRASGGLKEKIAPGEAWTGWASHHVCYREFASPRASLCSSVKKPHIELPLSSARQFQLSSFQSQPTAEEGGSVSHYSSFQPPRSWMDGHG
jgi:hypothetical protein